MIVTRKMMMRSKCRVMVTRKMMMRSKCRVIVTQVMKRFRFRVTANRRMIAQTLMVVSTTKTLCKSGSENWKKRPF